ncbi:hypothetical protein N0Y54_34880 [Nostoc punctiforme UO1]|uniref:hypothetical protein n=1 Tax=Nostoc punctiforme TaxID=272131 RepID=UPI003095BA11
MKITPNQILYINLGPDNEWRKDCIYTDTALPVAMRYILKAETYYKERDKRKTVLHNSRKCCNTIRLGYIQISHQLCLECKAKNQWNRVEEELKKHDCFNKQIKAHCKKIKYFYESGEDILWINFSKDKKLWWCFAKTNITLREDNTKERAVIGKWNCNNILGEPLELEYLNEKIPRVASQHTIYELKHSQEILEEINKIENQ